MLFAVGTDDLHFNAANSGPLPDANPGVPAKLNRIDAIGDHTSFEAKVILRDGMRDPIAGIIHWSANHTGVPDRLLNRINPQIYAA